MKVACHQLDSIDSYWQVDEDDDVIATSIGWSAFAIVNGL